MSFTNASGKFLAGKGNMYGSQMSFIGMCARGVGVLGPAVQVRDAAERADGG